GEDDFVECGYCDRKFVLSAKKKTAESEYHSPAARPPEAH
ncbi:MAG: zinc-finger domain-containing protein, partial [Brevundimonas sp.]